jgi:peroxiredoxin
MASSKQKTMLSAGDRAPDFDLEDLSGGRRTRSDIARGKSVVLAFFKASCPVCQFTFPFLERIYRGKTNRDIAIYAISEDDVQTTLAFNAEHGITLPTLLDKEEEGFPASNAYGLSYVPSIFLVEPNGVISQSLMGFDKKGLEELGHRLGKEPFRPTEYVPEFRSG